MLNGLASLSVELTSRCQKTCAMCGRRQVERDYPHLVNWGDMDFDLVANIANQLPPDIVVQFHDNGEPLLYPDLGAALSRFWQQVKCLDTNGKLLMEKADEIIGNLDTITLSTFEDDDEADEQYDVLHQFLEKKGDRKPRVVVRCLGRVDPERYRCLGLLVATRVFHSPKGSFDYARPVTIPEIGICLEALHHLSIKQTGKCFLCVRFNPRGWQVIGDAREETLEAIWNGALRQQYKARHIAGKRDEGMPLCATCHYWGCPVPMISG